MTTTASTTPSSQDPSELQASWNATTGSSPPPRDTEAILSLANVTPSHDVNRANLRANKRYETKTREDDAASHKSRKCNDDDDTMFSAVSSSRRVLASSLATQQRFVHASLANTLSGLQGRHFISIDELSNEELRGLLILSKNLKETYGKNSKVNPLLAPKPLTGQSVSMIFQKRSTRTRVSTETGMSLLGGHALFLGPSDVQLGVNESMKDTAKVLSGFNSLILARVFAHSDIMELAEHAEVPIINALSDLHHPLQTLADLMALEEHWYGDLAGKTLTWVGDGTNVLHDLMLGSVMMGMHVRVATPTGYEPDSGVVERTKKLAKANNCTVFFTTDAAEAVTGSDVVVTDTWVSMGQEEEYAKRVKDFEGYQVNNELMSKANKDAVFLHCLPRHKEEVSDDVFYSDKSLIFPEAENRMWTVMAVMAAQLGKIDF